MSLEVQTSPPPARPRGRASRALRRRPRLGLLLPLLALGLVLLAVARARLGQSPTAVTPLAAFPAVELEPLAPPPAGVTVRGTVRAAAGGVPVNQALVLARAGDAPVWDFTGERGEFELSGLEPGNALLRVSAVRFEAQDFLVGAPAEDVRLVLLHPLGPPPSLPPIERETLVGQVFPPRPEWVVTGYEVVLLPAEPEALGAPVPRRATVRPDRSFRFEELILGRYEVLVLPPWASGGSWPNLIAPAERELTHARSGALPRETLPLAAGRLDVRVHGAADQPLEGALILVHPEGQAARLWPPRATDADGGARIGDLPPGPYRVTVTAGEAELEQLVSVQAGATLRVELVL